MHCDDGQLQEEKIYLLIHRAVLLFLSCVVEMLMNPGINKDFTTG